MSGKNLPYFYALYDAQDMPVLITDDVREINRFLGNSSVNSTSSVISKYFAGKAEHLEDKNSKRYKIYKYSKR